MDGLLSGKWCMHKSMCITQFRINNYLKIDDDNCFECGLCFMNCSKEVLSK